MSKKALFMLFILPCLSHAAGGRSVEWFNEHVAEREALITRCDANETGLSYEECNNADISRHFEIRQKQLASYD